MGLSEVVEKEGQPTPGLEPSTSRPIAPVRVCFLIDNLACGGTETQLLALIRQLDRSRVQPYLALLNGLGECSLAMEPEDCPVLRFGVSKLLAFGTLAKMLHFRRYLKREQIDVLQMYFADSTYFGALTGRIAGVKSIVRTRNNMNHWMTPVHRWLGRRLNRLVTVTVCNSEAGRQAVLADERPDRSSVLVIENGVDLDRFADIPTVSSTPDRTRPRRVGMVANLRPVKGVDVLVAAAAQVVRSFPEVEFHVAGEGPQRADLERLIRELGLEGRFFLHGNIADIPSFLSRLDIAVLSSRAEGAPNALLEYMACGRAIVASRVGGIPKILGDQSGLTVPPDDPKALAEAIVHLLANPELRANMGSIARQRAAECFSRGAFLNRFHNFFEGMAHASRERQSVVPDRYRPAPEPW